jgi:hypothetical protein
MKKTIFMLALAFLANAVTVNAQLHNHKKSEKKAVSKRDPHLKFSQYQPPKKSKKETKKDRKEMRRLQAASYTPEQSKYYNKKDAKEAGYYKKRQERVRAGKDRHVRKEERKSMRAYDKKYKQKNNQRNAQIKQNKKNFGSKKSRKEFRTNRTA